MSPHQLHNCPPSVKSSTRFDRRLIVRDNAIWHSGLKADAHIDRMANMRYVPLTLGREATWSS